MYDKSVNTYPSTIKFVPECFISHEICDKKLIHVLDSIFNKHKV